MSHDNDVQKRLLATLVSVEAMDKAASETRTEVSSEEGIEDTIHSELPDVSIRELESKLSGETGSDLEEDYKRARNFTYALQDISLVMLKNICSLAVGTAHPRAYDTYNSLLTNMRGLNKDLMEINKAANDVKQQTRTLPPAEKPPEQEEGEGAMTTVTTDGKSVTVTMGKRPTTQSILEIIKNAKANEETIENEEIIRRAAVLEAEKAEDAEFESMKVVSEQPEETPPEEVGETNGQCS